MHDERAMVGARQQRPAAVVRVGTGAIEGMAHGIPSIALSQAMTYWHDEIVAHWETAEHFGPGIVERLIQVGWPADVVMLTSLSGLEAVDVVVNFRLNWRVYCADTVADVVLIPSRLPSVANLGDR